MGVGARSWFWLHPQPSLISHGAEAAEAALDSIIGAVNQDATFSLALSQDQKDIRDWVHGFAADVVRPAAHEWDEREETPWPIIQEAAKIGLYGFEGLAQFYADPSGLTLPIVNEELFWGDAGIGMSIMGTALAVAAIFGQGTPEQMGEWIPQCFGTPDDVKVAAFCASEPDAGSDISGLRTTAKFDETKNEWVLNGQKAWATNGGIADVHVVIASVDRELGARGHAAFVVPMSEAKGISQGSKVSKHGLRASHTADVFLDDCRVPGGYVLGGKEKLDERLARAREGKSNSQAAMATLSSSRPVVGAQALGVARAAYEYALQYSKEREQFHRKIVENQAIAFTRAHEAGDRRRPPARLARLMDGTQPGSVRECRGLDVEAQGRRGRGVGHRARDPDPRRLRLHARVPRRAHAPRRQDLRHLRGHRADPAARDRARDHGDAHQVGAGTGLSVVGDSSPRASRVKISVDLLRPDLTTVLHLDRDAPHAARLQVAELYSRSPDLRGAVVLLTSELLTRSVRQRDRASDQAVELCAWMSSDIARVELRGSSELLFRPPEPSGPHYDHILLDQIADRWSIDTHQGVARIWFEIDGLPATSQSSKQLPARPIVIHPHVPDEGNVSDPQSQGLIQDAQ